MYGYKFIYSTVTVIHSILGKGGLFQKRGISFTVLKSVYGGCDSMDGGACLKLLVQIKAFMAFAKSLLH